MGSALDKSLAGVVDAGKDVATDLVNCENAKNTMFYEHTLSMKLPYRAGQVSLLVGIILLVIAIILTTQHSKEDDDDSDAFGEHKGWWISTGVFVGLGIVLITYALMFLSLKFSSTNPKCAAELATARIGARAMGMNV